MGKTAKILIGLGAIVLIVIMFFSWANGIYDKAISTQETVKKEWGNVQASYQRRADLVPNLVATVKMSAENEKSILVQVTEARAGIVKAQSPADLERAGRQINTAINLAFEAYPQIRATQNFSDLQAQLEGTENRINKARTDYNEAVQIYNSHIRGFFRKKAIGIMGSDGEFAVKDEFKSDAGADKAPNVNELFKK